MNILVLFLVVTGTSARAENVPEKSVVYSLPDAVKRPLHDVAAGSDVLVLGETHGTQETPAVTAALLAPLSQLGYRVLALEIPADQREPLLAWAEGTTTVVPSFFAAPSGDGRGNIELLTLIRTAVSPPFRWQLICFDESEEKLGITEFLSKSPTEAELIALSVRRDMTMASNLLDQYQRQNANAKVLAICGNLHARIAKQALRDDLLNRLWPSFAAVLKSQKPDWRLSSVNVAPHRGGYFNGGKVNQFNDQAIEHVEFKRLEEGDWDFQLDLPFATPASFLKAPSDAIDDK